MAKNDVDDGVDDDDHAGDDGVGRGGSPVELDLELGIIVDRHRRGGSARVVEEHGVVVGVRREWMDDEEKEEDYDPYCPSSRYRRDDRDDALGGGGGEDHDDDYEDYDHEDDDYDDRCDGHDNVEDRDDGIENLIGPSVAREYDDHDDDDMDYDRSSSPVKRRRRPRPRPRRLLRSGGVPTLLSLATDIVSSHLERFPPGSFGTLSGFDWDNVVRRRVKTRNNGEGVVDEDDCDAIGTEGKGMLTLCGMGGGRGGIPALSERVLTAIETHPNNAHLSNSDISDNLLWRDIVNCAYRYGGMSRPMSLGMPCTLVKNRLERLGNELKCLVAYIVDGPRTMEEYVRMKDRVGNMVRRSKVESDSESEAICNKQEIDDYRMYLDGDANRMTEALRRVVDSLKECPMDVTMLTETGIGKKVRGAVRVMRKLINSVNNEGVVFGGNRSDDGTREVLRGYPDFWKTMDWTWNGGVVRGTTEVRGMTMTKNISTETPLVLLERILQGWKDMAAEDDNEATPTSSSVSFPPSKKRNTTENNRNEDQGCDSSNCIVTCGRAKNVSIQQHRIDMRLLHSSPTWRSLYQSLGEREVIVRRVHGDRVRSRREGLERDRPKVGKVVLRSAVGRVRGGDCDGRNGVGNLKPPPLDAAVGGGGGGGGGVVGERKRRREAILSKSLGHRARRQQQLAKISPSHAVGGSGALGRIRTESKIAASWSKSSFGGGGASVATKSSFGASVASAAGAARDGCRSRTTTDHGKVHVPLGNGRRMTLPASASFFAGAGRASSIGAAASPTRQHQKSAQGGAFTSIEDKSKKRRRNHHQNGTT